MVSIGDQTIHFAFHVIDIVSHRLPRRMRSMSTWSGFIGLLCQIQLCNRYCRIVSLSLSVSSVLFTKHLLFLPLFEGEFQYRLQAWEKELWGVGFWLSGVLSMTVVGLWLCGVGFWLSGMLSMAVVGLWLWGFGFWLSGMLSMAAVGFWLWGVGCWLPVLDVARSFHCRCPALLID